MAGSVFCWHQGSNVSTKESFLQAAMGFGRASAKNDMTYVKLALRLAVLLSESMVL